jgi:hypothetical protein
MVAGELRAAGSEVSFRKVAKLMRVQPSTVQRWFGSEAEFQAEADRLAPWFAPDGPFASIRKTVQALRKK